jgi:TrmH family RNA methyltransferase
MLAANIFVVLVNTEDNLNIGAVARAMKNLGFINLRLVAPLDFNLYRTKITARSSIDIVTRAKHFNTLSEALSDMHEAVAFSTKVGRNIPEPQNFLELAPDLFEEAKTRRIALIFGTESTGLKVEQMLECRLLARLPSSSEYDSYNLAQSVLLTLYELQRSGNVSCTNKESNMPQSLPRAEWGNFTILDEYLEEILTRSQFYNIGTPKTVPGIIKQLFRRLSPNEREMNILLGMFHQIKLHLKDDSA